MSSLLPPISIYHLFVFPVESPLISEVKVDPDVEPPNPMEIQPTEQVPTKEVEDLPLPITLPQSSSPSPVPSTPPVTHTQPPRPVVMHHASPPDVPLASVSPAQLFQGRVRGHLDLHHAIPPLFPREYPRGYPATGGFSPLSYPVDDMYGETVNVIHPGYVSPTGYTTTPYWTRPPEIDTQVSVLEVENEHGMRDEEVRSMNIVRELFNKIGNQVSKEELPSYIAGPIPNASGGPERERSIGMGMIAMSCGLR